MKINLAKNAGFCFGVKRAIDIAFKTAGSRQNVYMLGDIVHNEEVARQINSLGVKKLKRLTARSGRVLLIRAHGTAAITTAKALALGYRVVDATCPMVKEIHKTVKVMEQKGYTIIVIGDKKHDEVRGIVGQLKKKAIVIDNPKDPALRRLKKINVGAGNKSAPTGYIQKAAVVVQSTQNLEKVLAVLKELRARAGEVKFFNTICRPTTVKQQEIRIMPLENNVMLIIGSRSSANTRRLYEISRSLNRKSYWINSKKDIRRAWFSGAKSVGVTAGASTPDSTIKDVVSCLLRLNP
ncbi:MAG: 4-hydroxy-3-methylbut-2-enyl diphosphate reductase [Candidatus Omnitrophota bacterium]|nr:4-hydroxy-3-methylbut-2-enyl diphosphate reductase [Candidatus Omnitrophota bacterium]